MYKDKFEKMVNTIFSKSISDELRDDIGVRRGVSKRVEDGRKTITLQADHP
jgi:hypothetical protein